MSSQSVDMKTLCALVNDDFFFSDETKEFMLTFGSCFGLFC